jgi:hypothetical protein
VIGGYPGDHDGGDSAVDHNAARAGQERAQARHARKPWCHAAVRALAEGDHAGWDEETWKSRLDPAWPKYFANLHSPLAAPHMARFRTEVRMNLAMSSAWFGDVHHFDDIDSCPSLARVRCPSLVIAGKTTSSAARRGTDRSQQRFRQRVTSRSLTQVTSHSTSNRVRSGPRCSTGWPPPDYRPDGRPESGAGAEATGSTARGQTFAPDGRSPQMRFPQYRARTARYAR